MSEEIKKKQLPSSHHQDAHCRRSRSNWLLNFLLGNKGFCPILREQNGHRFHQEKKDLNAFVVLEDLSVSTSSMSQENIIDEKQPLNKTLTLYSQKDVEDMISEAVAKAADGSEAILTQSSRLELDALRTMYEQTRDEYVEEIQRMQKQIGTLQLTSTATDLKSAAALKVEEEHSKESSEVNIETAVKQEHEKISEPHEKFYESCIQQTRDEYTQEIQSLQSEMEHIVKRYQLEKDDDDSLPLFPSEESHHAQEIASSTDILRLLMNQIDDILAQQSKHHLEKEKKLNQKSRELSELYEHQFARENEMLRSEIEDVIKRHRLRLDDDAELLLPSKENCHLQGDASGNRSPLIKLIDGILAQQSEQTLEKDKLITFLSTQLVDAEAVISTVEGQRDISEQRANSLANEVAAFKSEVALYEKNNEEIKSLLW